MACRGSYFPGSQGSPAVAATGPRSGALATLVWAEVWDLGPGVSGLTSAWTGGLGACAGVGSWVALDGIVKMRSSKFQALVIGGGGSSLLGDCMGVPSGTGSQSQANMLCFNCSFDFSTDDRHTPHTGCCGIGWGCVFSFLSLHKCSSWLLLSFFFISFLFSCSLS